MNYPADSTAKLCQGGKGRYVGREGVPVDNCSPEPKSPWIEDILVKIRLYTLLGLFSSHKDFKCFQHILLLL